MGVLLPVSVHRPSGGDLAAWTTLLCRGLPTFCPHSLVYGRRRERSQRRQGRRQRGRRRCPRSSRRICVQAFFGLLLRSRPTRLRATPPCAGGREWSREGSQDRWLVRCGWLSRTNRLERMGFVNGFRRCRRSSRHETYPVNRPKVSRQEMLGKGRFFSRGFWAFR